MTTKQTTTTATAQRPKNAAKPQDHKKAASAKVKALQKEAEAGTQVVEVRGETYTLRKEQFQNRVRDDYEFMEMVTQGVLPVMINELLSKGDADKMKDACRSEDGRVSTEGMADLFQEIMEAGGLGN